MWKKTYQTKKKLYALCWSIFNIALAKNIYLKPVQYLELLVVVESAAGDELFDLGHTQLLVVVDKRLARDPEHATT